VSASASTVRDGRTGRRRAGELSLVDAAGTVTISIVKSVSL
jgi:hypothetical protein